MTAAPSALPTSTSLESDALRVLYADWADIIATTPELTIRLFRSIFDEWHQPTREPEDVTYREETVGGIPGIWAFPAGADTSKVLLYTHGGGFAVGSASSHRKLAAHVAKALGVVSFVLDYRRAPEHPHPAQVEDGVAAFTALTERGIAPADITTIGDSAGGNLAVAIPARQRQQSVAAAGRWPRRGAQSRRHPRPRLLRRLRPRPHPTITGRRGPARRSPPPPHPTRIRRPNPTARPTLDRHPHPAAEHRTPTLKCTLLSEHRRGGRPRRPAPGNADRAQRRPGLRAGVPVGRRLRGGPHGIRRPAGHPARPMWRARHIGRDQPEAKAGATTASELMTAFVEAVAPTTPVATAARLMVVRHLRWLAVCDPAGRIVGVISRSDVLAVFLRDDASIHAEIVDDVLAADPMAEEKPLQVEVSAGVVTLTGEVATRGAAERLVRSAGRVEGVVAVVDQMQETADDQLTDAQATPSC